MKPSAHRIALIVACCGWLGLLFLASLRKYHAFAFTGLDLGILTQVFWNTAHGDAFGFSMMQAGYLGYHAEWLIVLLAPVFALVTHPLTLVMLQGLALVSCVWPISRIAKKVCPRMNFVFPLLWLLNPTVWRMALYEFHLLTFAIPILLWAAFFFLEKRFQPFLVAVALALLVREDVAFGVAGFSALAFLERRERGTRWITTPLLLCIIAWFVNRTVIHHFAPASSYAYSVYYAWLRETPLRLIAAHLIHPGTFDLLLGLLLPVLFLPLFRPRFLLLSSLPFLQFALTEQGATDVILQTHYASLLLPGLFVAAIEGATQLQAHGRLAAYRPLLAPAMLFAAAFGYFGFGPSTDIIRTYDVTSRRAAQTRAINLIPSAASIVSPDALLAPLAMRREVFLLRYAWLGKTQFGAEYTLPTAPDYFIIDDAELREYAAVDNDTPWVAEVNATANARLRAMLSAGGYGVIFSENGVSVYQKNAADGAAFEVRWQDPGKPPTAHHVLNRVGTQVAQ